MHKCILVQKILKTIICDVYNLSYSLSNNPTPKMQNIGPKEGFIKYSDGSFSKKLQPI